MKKGKGEEGRGKEVRVGDQENENILARPRQLRKEKRKPKGNLILMF